MINIIITALGVVLVIGGFYAMSFGFLTPPNISFFFTGLVLTVIGAMTVIIYGSKIDFEDFRSKKVSTSSSTPAGNNNVIKPKPLPKKAEIPESPKKIDPVAVKPQESNIKRLVTARKDTVIDDNKSEIIPEKVEGEKTADKTISELVKKVGNNPEVVFKEIKSVSTDKTDENKPKIIPSTDNLTPEKSVLDNEPKIVSKEIKPVPIGKPKVNPGTINPAQKPVLDKGEKLKMSKEIKPVPLDKPKSITERMKSPFIRKKAPSKDKENNAVIKKMEPVKHDNTEEEYVKNRLNRLKENYIKNATDIENLIEERLDSFKGTLNQIKSESKDPSIIWSFNAGDVQETMQETILKSDNKILMMYPWVRNIDVSVLKRFMETESKMILQEASLDDDASVELIKLLMENNVEIRTMPHVHTIAIVSDEDNGLIISTDPIYESFEVGVVYKDQKSIEEIERMFEEAWNISQDIDLSLD